MAVTVRKADRNWNGATGIMGSPELEMGPEVQAALIQDEAFDMGADACVRLVAVRSAISARSGISDGETALLLGLGGLGVRLRHP